MKGNERGCHASSMEKTINVYKILIGNLKKETTWET
jgi:hypothetical protein